MSSMRLSYKENGNGALDKRIERGLLLHGQVSADMCSGRYNTAAVLGATAHGQSDAR